MSEPFGILTEAEVIALIAQNQSAASVEDTYDVIGGGAGESVSLQELIDAMVAHLFEVTSVPVYSNEGDRKIVVTLTPDQQANGFTTAHIVGHTFVRVSSTLELSVTDMTSMTDSSVTYELSGIEDVDGGHLLTVLFRKPKA